MLRFAEVFPDHEIVSTLSRQLSWSHFIEIIPFKNDLQRDFYAELCRVECWSVRTLRQKIGGMLFERTALSKKPDKLIRKELNALRAEQRWRLPAGAFFRRFRPQPAARERQSASRSGRSWARHAPGLPHG